MNKKVSTLLVATLLAAGPAFTAAYAAPEAVALTEYSKVEVTDGFRFFYGEDNALLKVKKVTLKNKQVVWTIADASELNEATTAKFEIRNMRKSGTNVLFELWANGNKIYVTNTGKAVEEDANVALTSLYSDFYASNANEPSKFTGNEVKEIKVFVPGENVTLGGNGVAYVGYTSKEEYNQADFKEYNGNVDLKAFSFSFNTETEKVEGNVFTDMVAVDSKVANKVLFVKGDAKQIQKFINASKNASYDFAETGKSLNFVAIDTKATYNINALQANEGKKLVVVTGETLAKDTESRYVLEFAVTESDRLNAEGELTLNAAIGANDVLVGAVRPSATDNTTYVTTMKAEGSEFSYIPAQLGSNAYLDASILLNKNAKNVVSVYFTSGTPATGEYHKYLTASFGIKAYNEADPTIPENQWVVKGFDGKYTFTLANRANSSETIALSLVKGGAEGGYKVSKAVLSNGQSLEVSDQSKISAKFLTVTTTKTDGYLSLTDAQVKEGIKLAFTGKTALAGEKTFYAVNDNNELIPSLKQDGIVKLMPVVAMNETNPKEVAILNSYDFAYLNDKGEVATKKDTLYVPAYNFITSNEDKEDESDDKYLSDNAVEVVKSFRGTYAFAKTAEGYAFTSVNVSGSYEMARNADVYTVTSSSNTALEFTKKALTAVITNNNDILNQSFANVKILSGAELNMSLPAQQGHFTFDNERGSISMTDIKGINEGALANEGMVFWLDSVDTDAEMPAFYISRGIEGNEAARLYMYNTIDSAKVFDEASANYKYNDVYFYGEDAQNGKNPELKVGFAAATEEAGKDLADQFKFNITLKDAAVADEYILSSVKKVSLPKVNPVVEDATVYVAQKNGVVILTAEKENAMAFTLNPAEAPTSNESVSASEVKVVANNGSVVVKNAAGKNVVVSTILGQVVANEVLTSDNATINVPAGIVVVAVDGESFKVNVK
ncbi:MAG: DUF6383 domain-containing protein [Parabacteroides sp.]|nr:DUF6383 domain-containing protein [Parabacteroides sp.]